MQFEITVHCPELETLAQALNGFKGQPAETVLGPVPGTQITPAATPAPPLTPNTSHVQTPPAPAVTQASVAAAAPAYDKETLVRAAAELMDRGMQQDLLQLLARFNVPSMMALDPSQFAEFGAAMKEMGAEL